MPNQPLSTRPPSAHEITLKEKYAECFANQSDLMDKIAQQLITLELAIPGLYATALKLVAGKNATITIDYFLYATFGCWASGLGLTLMVLIPRAWQVDPEVLQQDPDSKTEVLGLKDFFVKTARYKQKRLVFSAVLFFTGIAFAALTVA